LSLDQAQGFALALSSMVLYGLYMVPRKSTGIGQGAFTFWMGCGILAGTCAFGLLFGGLERVTLAQFAWMFASGVVWATGTHAYCRGVQLIGLSRSTPVKNTSAMLGTLLGIAAFHEFASGDGWAVGMVLAGSLAVVVSATMLGRVESNDEAEMRKIRPGYYAYGVVCSVWAAIAFSVYTVPMKALYAQGVSPSGFLFYMGFGCFAGMCLTAALTGGFARGQVMTWRDRNLAQVSGIMWAVGSYCANVAVKLIGVAVTWPLTKNTVVAVLYGVLVLKEVDARRHRRDLWIGLVLSVAGVALLALAMGRR